MKESQPKNKDKHESLDQYRSINQNQCSVTHTLHTLHTNKEKREPRSIRIRPSAYTFISNYARLSKMNVGEVVEEACFFYIDQYPVTGNVFIIEKNKINTQVDLRERVLTQLCTREIKEVLEAVKNMTRNGRVIHKSIIKKLLRALDKYYKISEPSEELDLLVKEALTYLE